MYFEIVSGAKKYRLATPSDFDKNEDADLTNNVTIVDARYVEDVNGKYIRIADTRMINYSIVSFDATKTFNITPATLEITPDNQQYKIYGEADPEIKFTVQTEYEIADTHYQLFTDSNIVKLCNGSTCYEGADIDNYRYTARLGTQSDTGTYILLIKGWTVTLGSYAYEESSGDTNHLDYGQNFTATKYGEAESSLGQDASDVVHYDKYTSYKATITTSRILLGNLYVESHDQSVGVKYIVNGLKVAQNNLKTENSGATIRLSNSISSK